VHANDITLRATSLYLTSSDGAHSAKVEGWNLWLVYPQTSSEVRVTEVLRSFEWLSWWKCGRLAARVLRRCVQCRDCTTC
jgi:hypothetical protein